MRASEAREFVIKLHGNQSMGDFTENLEKLAHAAHALLEQAFDNGAVANAPDMQNLFQCAATANLAYAYAKALAMGQVPQEQQPQRRPVVM